jgi:hypothetical protein
MSNYATAILGQHKLGYLRHHLHVWITLDIDYLADGAFMARLGNRMQI